MTLRDGMTGIRGDGQRTGPLVASEHWPGCLCADGCVWTKDGTLAGASPGGMADIVGVVP